MRKNKDFWDKVKSKLPLTSKILDLGDNKNLFKEYKFYTISKDFSLTFLKKDYSCILATNFFEYDPFYEISLLTCINSISLNGVFVFTISFTPVEDDDIDYYKHLTEKEIRRIFDIDKYFNEYQFELNEDNDLLFYGIKK